MKIIGDSSAPEPISYPEMILFDYGHTLLSEPGWSVKNGIAALSEYIAENPRGADTENVARAVEHFMENELSVIKNSGFDIPWHEIMRFITSYFGIILSVTPEVAETIYWDGETPGACMPGALKMLRNLSRAGIRTAVVSNLTMSGNALKRRIDRLLPENGIEFAVTSADLVFRKPDRRIFDAALGIAGVRPEKAWFCGDNPSADIEGAAGAGLFPVWYDSDIDCPYRDKEAEKAPLCRFLHIKELGELTAFLSTIKIDNKSER